MVKNPKALDDLKRAFGKVYYQFDPTEYKADRIDQRYLNNLKQFFHNFHRDGVFDIEPVLIPDCHYPDADDAQSKVILNKIASGASHNQSGKQYLRDTGELYRATKSLFDPLSWDIDALFERMCRNAVEIAEGAEAIIETERVFMPEYDMTPEEKSKYGDTHTMFLSLLEDGFQRLVPNGKEDEYRRRLEKEIYVLESTDSIDYTLVQWDTANWARSQGILVGAARGSAGGSLALYLLGITLVDPIKFNLLFERFLLPERAGLYSARTTKIVGRIESRNYVEVRLENGRTVNFDRDARLMVRRGDEELDVYADELSQRDDILMNNRDLLFCMGYNTGVLRISNVKAVNQGTVLYVLDSEVGDGYLQGSSRQLADVDIDFQADRRNEVKEYLERRYNTGGRQRVFSAGTYSTMKLRACLKDVCRVYKIPVSLANYITAIFETTDVTWTDLFKLAARNAKVRKFVNDYPDAVEEMRPLLGQPRSASVHASAILITPETKDGREMECFDFTPIKKVDDLLVSEFDGYSLDEIGLLKNDILGINELTKIQAVLNEIDKVYRTNLTFEEIVRSDLDNEKTYRLLSDGFTANVFQMSATGITKYLQDIQPGGINDLIAATALYRPATLESGSAENYLRCKVGEVAPVYLWGTYDALNTTYAVMTFQEQISQIAREVGGFSLAEGVGLLKLISKKKVDAIHAMKEKFMAGAAGKGCPKEDAVAIWELIESSGSYLLNRAHATAYAITAYVGAWLKANYASAFYTVALQWADDKEIATLMGEMEQCSTAKIVPPDINVSGVQFHTDYDTDQIYWSLGRIRMLGIKTAEHIVAERKSGGAFTGITDFIQRIFRGRWSKDETGRIPVTSLHVKNLILAGCFDKVEGIEDMTERYAILKLAAATLGFELDETEFSAGNIEKHHFWSRLQVAVSGIGSIDYRRVFDGSAVRGQIKGWASWMSLRDALIMENEGKKVAVCATVIEVEELSYKDRETGDKVAFAKLTLQQNTDTIELVLWNDFYERHRREIAGLKDRIVVVTANIKYSDYTGSNALNTTKSSILSIE
jgi:DNA polymerase-3 subunit alpha